MMFMGLSMAVFALDARAFGSLFSVEGVPIQEDGLFVEPHRQRNAFREGHAGYSDWCHKNAQHAL
ncbi:hypothetical protein [Bosea sp. BK604]|uniref:hypothetical protein n=1 Tax=Bosea sp. BK604 TaxID=2512180 RepID=UPI001046D302|nr:hypothetical protein [Bosea sp. BK604]